MHIRSQSYINKYLYIRIKWWKVEKNVYDLIPKRSDWNNNTNKNVN